MPYVVYEENGKACAIVDSVLDYDAKSGHTSTAGADRIIAFIAARDLKVNGCWKPVHMQIICRQRPTCMRKWAEKSPLARAFESSRAYSSRSSIWMRASSSTAHSCTTCLPTTMYSISADFR